MSTDMLQLEWEPCALERLHDPVLERFWAKEAAGKIAPVCYYLAHCPWVARADVTITYYNGTLAHLDFEVADIVGLAVSRENSCRHCYAMSRALMRLSGMSDARMRAVESGFATAALSPRIAAAVSFAQRMARGSPLVGDPEKEKLAAAGFSADQQKELAFVVASMCFGNRVSTFPAVPPYGWEKYPDQWLPRLMRPLISHWINKKLRKRASPAAGNVLSPYVGPFADVVQAYAGTPIAPALAQVLEDAWSSTLLSRRCKALLFAVVGTGLDCKRSVAQVWPVLAEHGLGESVIARVLDHLGAEELDATENLLLPFARETLWYQPAQIQRRARQVREQLSAAQFVEAVGILALANSLCRLGAFVRERT